MEGGAAQGRIAIIGSAVDAGTTAQQLPCKWLVTMLARAKERRFSERPNGLDCRAVRHEKVRYGHMTRHAGPGERLVEHCALGPPVGENLRNSFAIPVFGGAIELIVGEEVGTAVVGD